MVIIIPFSMTVEQIAIHIPFNPQSIANKAVSGIRNAFIGNPTIAGGKESPAPENAPLRITSAAEKTKTDAAILLYVEAALMTSTSLTKIN